MKQLIKALERIIEKKTREILNRIKKTYYFYYEIDKIVKEIEKC